MIMNHKKYHIIKTLEDDAPYGDVNWGSISFLTPQRLESTKYLDVKGFKVHNGYNTLELANTDIKALKEKHSFHDIYLFQMGKIYGWDDSSKTDTVEYDNDKLNDLEKTRRESMSKIKLITEQFKNEHTKHKSNSNAERIELQRKRYQQKLYEKGLITKKEYDTLQEEKKTEKEVKKITDEIDRMRNEMEECSKEDYLDENEPTGLKYGCISIFSPKNIGGLSTLCFKVRGMFETIYQLNKRVQKLQQIYPNDRLYSFEVGKWCSFCEKDDTISPSNLLEQLNYFMKCYIASVKTEKEEFEKRKEQLQSKTDQESKMVKSRRQDRKKKTRKEPINPEPQAPETEDDQAIKEIMDYLEDPELKDKYAIDKSLTQTVDVDLKN